MALRLGKWIEPRRGGAMVEFAIILPMLTLVMFGIVEAGRAWQQEQVLATAAREGVRVASVYNMTYTRDTVTDAIHRYLRGGGINPDSVTISGPNWTTNSRSDVISGSRDSVALTFTLRFPVLSRLTRVLPSAKTVTATAYMRDE